MKKIIAAIAVVAVIFSCFSACSVLTTLTIAQNGQSGYVIVRSATASDAEITASTELQSYLLKITGATLEIKTDESPVAAKEIVVGNTSRTSDIDISSLGEDGFIIKTAGEKIIIAGSGVRGALYGVYSFLEEYLGCRYYTPDVEKIPEQQTLTLKTIPENRQVPVFTYRCPYWTSAFDENFSVKQKMNGAPGRMISNEYGGCIKYAGKETEEYQVHTLWRLAEMKHDGSGNLVYTDEQPCLTDPAVYETVLKNVRAVLREYPDAKIISVSQNDSGADKRCKCENCLAIEAEEESAMGPVLKFVNHIADDIKEEFPDVLISTLAYYYTIKPPKNITPHDNVAIQLCPVECCRAHSITECNVGSLPELETNFYSYLQQWAKICNNIQVWDYTTDFMYFQTPFPNFDSMQKDAAVYAENNVTWMFSQGLFQTDTSTSSGEFAELRAYLIAKLMWNPKMSSDEYYAYMDDFLEGYYGSGGSALRKYIDAAQQEASLLGTGEKTVDGLRHWDIYDAVLPDSNKDTMEIFPYKIISIASKTQVPDPAFLNTAKAFFDEAETLAEGEQLDRVQCARMQIEFYESVFLVKEYEYMVISYKRIYLSSNPERQQKLDELKEAYDLKMTEVNKSLYAKYKRFGITRMSEGFFICDENDVDWTLPCTSWMIR